MEKQQSRKPQSSVTIAAEHEEEIIRFMDKLSICARQATLPLFRSGVLVDNKSDTGFDPVTEADRNAEADMRELICETYPSHAIIGEEMPEKKKRDGSRHAWVLDPIDGTSAFISGQPNWATLIGFLEDEIPQFGMMVQPFIDEMFWADGLATYHQNKEGVRQINVSNTTKIEQALLCATNLDMFDQDDDMAFFNVKNKVQMTRLGTDCYGYAMLAAGFVDLVVEAQLKPVDILPLVPIIEQAGGIVTNWQGARNFESGQAIAAATPQLHQSALEILNN